MFALCNEASISVPLHSLLIKIDKLISYRCTRDTRLGKKAHAQNFLEFWFGRYGAFHEIEDPILSHWFNLRSEMRNTTETLHFHSLFSSKSSRKKQKMAGKMFRLACNLIKVTSRTFLSAKDWLWYDWIAQQTLCCERDGETQ